MHAASVREVLLLTAVAFGAGSIDAIAGGGGLLTLPALLAMGLSPHAALATNKGQSVFGALAATARFARARAIDWRRARATFPAGLLGALAGATMVLAMSPEVLRPVVVAMLVAAGLFVGLRRPPGQEARASVDSTASNEADGGSLGHTRRAKPERVSRPQKAAAIALALGAYDGFFGPGTGTFLIVLFAALLGERLTRASADAKVVNFASNLAAASLFAARGAVLWRIALPMAAAQLVGGWFGAHLALRRGDTLVRRAVVLVTIVLAAKLAWDMR